MKALVYNNTTPAGILEKTTDEFVFTYLNEYYNDSTKHAISLSFPKTQKRQNLKPKPTQSKAAAAPTLRPKPKTSSHNEPKVV